MGNIVGLQLITPSRTIREEVTKNEIVSTIPRLTHSISLVALTQKSIHPFVEPVYVLIGIWDDWL